MADNHSARAAAAAVPVHPATAPLSADPAGLSQPLHLLRIARAEGAAATPAQEGTGHHSSADVLAWLNAPATAAAAASDESRSLAPPAPAQLSGAAAAAAGPAPPAVPVLLSVHLAAVRRLQTQVPLFKHQLRALLDGWMAPPDTAAASAAAIAAALAAGQDGATAALAGDAAAAALVARHAKESMSRSQSLKDAFTTIYAGLTSQPYNFNVGQAHQARLVFDSLDASVYSPTMDVQPVSRSARVANPQFGKTRESVMGATTPWITGRPPAILAPQPGQKDHRREGNAAPDSAVAAAAAAQHVEDERLYSAASASSPSTSTVAAAAAAASPSTALPSLLSASAACFNEHSGLLLNLVQCSGINPFEQMQQKIRTQFVMRGPGDDAAATVAAVACSAAAGAAAAAAPLSPSPSPSPTPSPSVDPHVVLLDALLLHFLRVQHGRNQEACLLQQQAAMQQSRDAKAAAVAAAAAAAAAAGAAGASAALAASDAAAHAATTARDLASLASPALPFLRKVFAPSSLASPYAPRASPSSPPHAIAAHASNPLLGLVFSLPHVLHAYIEFERDEDEDGEVDEAGALHEAKQQEEKGNENGAAARVAGRASAAASASVSASASRGLSVSRLSVVHWSELAVLVDGHASSAFGLHRAVAAQAQLAVWFFKQLVERQTHAEATPATATAQGAQAGATAAAAPAAEVLQHKQMRVLHHLLVRRHRNIIIQHAWAPRCLQPRCTAPRCFQLWLCSYWDLQSRPCAECKCSLSLDAPHALSFAHAGATAAPLSSAAAAPLSHAPAVPLAPVVRMLGTETRDYVALHRACVEPYALAHARSK